MRLTELAISKLRPPKSAKYSWHPDALLPSFGIRVYSTGRRAWGITRRWDGAKHPTFRKLGEHPTMGLAAARARAREILADPDAHQEPAEVPAPDTFATLAAAFLKHRRTKRGRILRPSTVAEYKRALLTYAVDLHDRPVLGIKRAEVASLITGLAAEHPTTAMRTRAALSRFWSWAIANGHVETNPVAGTEGYDVAERTRVLADGELAALWTATAEPGDFNLIVRLCLWTGCRRSEIGGMRWSDLADGVLTIPGTRTKNHRPLVLPLPASALAAIEAHPRFVGRDLIFGRGPNGFQAWSQSKRRLDARLGFAKSWDLHDLRRTVQTRMVGLGINRDVVNKILNHAVGPIDEAYDHHAYLAEKAGALRKWSDKLARIIGRGESKVVAFR